MCGIVFTDNKGKSRAAKEAFSRYQAQSARGKLGFGCVSVAHKKVNKVYRSIDERGIRKILGDKSDMVLFHHRMPTSTPNLEECTHPIFVSNELLEYDYYIVHNGVISNPNELKLDFEKLGFVYKTCVQEMYKINEKFYESGITKFNDSESFAIDMAIAIEQGSKKIKSKGSVAFVALQVNKDTQIVDTVFFGRNTNPLKMQNVKATFMLASVGEGEEVEPHHLYAYDVKTQTITKTALDIGENYKAPVSYLPPRREPEPETRVPFRSPFGRQHKHYGSGNRQLIDDFPKHNATMEILKQKAKEAQDKKASKHQPLTSSTATLSEKDTRVVVKFNMRGDFLDGTSIHINELQYVENYQWKWYLLVMKTRDELIKDKIAINKSHRIYPSSNSKALEKSLEQQIKARSHELTLISDMVKSQVPKEVENQSDKPEPIKVIKVM